MAAGAPAIPVLIGKDSGGSVGTLCGRVTQLALSACALILTTACSSLEPNPIGQRVQVDALTQSAPQLRVGKGMTLDAVPINGIACRFELERLAQGSVRMRGHCICSNKTDRLIVFGTFEDIFHHLEIYDRTGHRTIFHVFDAFRKDVAINGHQSNSIPFDFDIVERMRSSDGGLLLRHGRFGVPAGEYRMRFVYDLRLSRLAKTGEACIIPWSGFVRFEVPP